jgi:transcriptional regulator with XRE-family HTH domain
VTTDDKAIGFTAEVDQNIGRNLRAARERAGISQLELARMVGDLGVEGFHQTTIVRIENGNRPLRAAEAIAICRVLDVTLEYLAESAATASLRSFIRSLDESADSFQAAVRNLVYQRWNVAYELDNRIPYDAEGFAAQETILRANVDPVLYEMVENRLAETDPTLLLQWALSAERASGRIGYELDADGELRTRLHFIGEQLRAGGDPEDD